MLRRKRQATLCAACGAAWGQGLHAVVDTKTRAGCLPGEEGAEYHGLRCRTCQHEQRGELRVLKAAHDLYVQIVL